MMDDVEQALARERMAIELKGAQSKRDLAMEAMRRGADPAYIAMRYDQPLELMERARKRYLEIKAEEIRKRGG
jgi:hypothetical protein